MRDVSYARDRDHSQYVLLAPIADSQSAKRIVHPGSLKQVPEAIRVFPVWAGSAER